MGTFQAVTGRSWATLLTPGTVTEPKILFHYSANRFHFIFFKLCQSLTSVPQVQIIFTQRRNATSEPKLFFFLAKAWSFDSHIYLQTLGRKNIKQNKFSPQILPESGWGGNDKVWCLPATLAGGQMEVIGAAPCSGLVLLSRLWD